jgi:hypothetical protein
MKEEARIIACEVAAIKAATDRYTLDALYVEYVGYSRVEDEPWITEGQLRADLIDYQREICHASGTDCTAVGLV